MTKRLMAGIVLPVVFAVGAGSAIAAATSDGNVIRACAGKGGKALHLAPADGKCAKGETALLVWNQNGRLATGEHIKQVTFRFRRGAGRTATF